MSPEHFTLVWEQSGMPGVSTTRSPPLPAPWLTKHVTPRHIPAGGGPTGQRLCVVLSDYARRQQAPLPDLAPGEGGVLQLLGQFCEPNRAFSLALWAALNQNIPRFGLAFPLTVITYRAVQS